MAIKVDITKNSGLNISYIRISKIAINYNLNQSIVTLEEYVSEDYRNKAKKQIEVRQNIKELFKQLESTKDTELSKAITLKIQQLQIINEELLKRNYAVATRDISLDYIPENTTYEGFYNELKQIEEFKNADMI